jgi:hypothetical protein
MATTEVLQKGNSPKSDATMTMAEIAKYYLGRGKKGAEAKPAPEPREEPAEPAPRRPPVMGEKNPANKEALEAAGMKAGGKVGSLFKGKETMSEELKEAKAIKSGKITPMQYAKGEKMEASKKFAKGGSVSSRADGIAQRGKTRGKMC